MTQTPQLWFHDAPDQPCSRCRSRHLKCVKTHQGGCVGCQRAQHFCDGYPGGQSIINVPNQYREQPLKAQTFHQFANFIAPVIGRGQTYAFWMQSVMPMAHSENAVFNAVLSLAALYTLPLTETASGRPLAGTTLAGRTQLKTAIEWYTQSVGQSALIVKNSTAGSLISALVTISLYLAIELRQDHHENVTNLVRSAFAIISTKRELFWKESLKDRSLLACLGILLEFTVTTTVDSTCITQDQWVATMILALRMAAEQGAPESFQLRVEVLNLAYDLNAYIAAGSWSTGNKDLEYRMKDYHRRLTRYRTSLDTTSTIKESIFGLEGQLLECQIIWRSQQQFLLGHNLNLEEKWLEDRIDTLATRIGAIHKHPNPLYTNAFVDQGIYRLAIFLVWHWRRRNVVAAVKKLLVKHQPPSPYLDRVLSFISTVAVTEYGRATALEIEVFGPEPPVVLQRWQLNRLANHLARVVDAR